MIEYDQIIKSIEQNIVNKKAKSTLLESEVSHPTPYFHTRDSLLKLIVQLLKSAQKYDNNQTEYEGDDKYVYATEIDETSFASVSDQWIQGLYIFRDYKDLLSTLIDFKKGNGDQDAIDSLENDPNLAIGNFE